MIYCSKHRLPENHNCPFDLRKKGKYPKSIDKPLYQDALEFMSKELTVAKIYEFVTTKQMSKSEAIELLEYFIENSDNSEIRTVSIQAFKVLDLKSDRAFHVLESCLLSDEDLDVKKATANVLACNFSEKSKSILNWFKKYNKIINK